jgi:hypothetical protein
MKNRIAAVTTVLLLVVGGSAFGALNDGNGNGNPTTTPSGKCPPGQNQTTSPGGLKKCE